MIYDLDAFSPVRPGASCTLRGALYRRIDNAFYNDMLGQHVAVVCLTEGFTPTDWSVIMAWNTHSDARRAAMFASILERHSTNPDVVAAAQANTLSVTREDGLDWLRTMLLRKPTYWGRVPVWTRRALREVKAEHGFTHRQLAGWSGLKTRPERMGDWAKDIR